MIHLQQSTTPPALTNVYASSKNKTFIKTNKATSINLNNKLLATSKAQTTKEPNLTNLYHDVNQITKDFIYYTEHLNTVLNAINSDEQNTPNLLDDRDNFKDIIHRKITLLNQHKIETAKCDTTKVLYQKITTLLSKINLLLHNCNVA